MRDINPLGCLVMMAGVFLAFYVAEHLIAIIAFLVMLVRASAV